MRFMLYNIRYATGRRVRWAWADLLRRTTGHLADIGRFVSACAPDVVGLVEVDAGSYRSGRLNQAESLAREMGHYHAYRIKYRERSLLGRLPVVNLQGNAFLTRDAIQRQTFHDFQSGVKRLVIELELDTVNLFLVHLSLRFKTRQHQLADLHDLVRSSTKPSIVAGDFNIFWGESEIRLFLAATGLISANTLHRPTYPSWAPRRELDFVCYSPSLKLVHCDIPSVRLSDHLPILCDFDLPVGA